MTTPTDRPTPRREFIGQLTASAIVLATAACAPGAAGQASTTPAPTPTPRPTTPPAPVHWDDSWFGRLTARHKAIFDSPAVEDGIVFTHATGYITGMRDAALAGLTDVQTVIVIRHAGIPMAFNDAMWEKYEIGKTGKIKDFSTDKWATRNPFVAPSPPKAGAAARPAPTNARPQANMMWFANNGHILLGCDRATRGYAFQIAERTKADNETIYQELKANVVPGIILQPTGVYAVHRAQEAGCTFIKSA
jgi:hypothetical protein